MKFPGLVSKELVEDHIWQLVQKLLDAIAYSDWQTYAELTDETATCLEPEAGGALIKGAPFHKFWFDISAPAAQTTTVRPVTTICNPTLRLCGEHSDTAICTYNRIVQSVDATGKAKVTQSAETRIFVKRKDTGKWVHTHVHRHLVSAL